MSGVSARRCSGSLPCVQSDHKGVDVDKAHLPQVDASMVSSWFRGSPGRYDPPAFAVEDEAVGPVPALDDVETFLD